MSPNMFDHAWPGLVAFFVVLVGCVFGLGMLVGWFIGWLIA